MHLLDFAVLTMLTACRSVYYKVIGHARTRGADDCRIYKPIRGTEDIHISQRDFGTVVSWCKINEECVQLEVPIVVTRTLSFLL